VTLYDGAWKLLITGRIGILGLCSFSCAFSVGGEGFLSIRDFILCLSVIELHCCSVFCIRFFIYVGGIFGEWKGVVSLYKCVCTFIEYFSERTKYLHM
jgi:hypothetical protein